VALIVAWLSLSLAPQGATQFQLLLNKQDALTEFDTLEPGRFQALNDGSRVTYTEELTNDRTNLWEACSSPRKAWVRTPKTVAFRCWWPKRAARKCVPDGSRWLILDNGYRYDGNPGLADYRAIKYDTYGVLLAQA
jgi:lipopolysaccharide export system permease protein